MLNQEEFDQLPSHVKEEIEALRITKDNATSRFQQTLERASHAERQLQEFKDAVVNEAVQYLKDNGPCRDVTNILDNLGLELPKKCVSFTVVTRTYVTVTVTSDDDPKDSDFLRGLVRVDSDGTVNVHGFQVEDVEITGADVDGVENIELAD